MGTEGNTRGELKTGATGSRTGHLHRFRAYLRHHRHNAIDSLGRLLAAPLQSLMTLLVIAIALALPGLLYLGVQNVERLSGSIDGSARMTVFLQRDITASAAESLAARLQEHQQVVSVVFISSDQALTEFSNLSGFGEVLALLDENPLPPALVVQPGKVNQADAGQLARLVAELRKEPLVDDVVLDMVWLQRLQEFLSLFQRLVLGLAVFLGLGVLLVMGNTVRMAIENRRQEIVVVKLIGGTDGYVRRPFLYSGFWFGALGGLLAWLLIWAATLLLQTPVARLADLYQNPFMVIGPGLLHALVLVPGGALLGWIGAWLAVSQHLHRIEPA